MDPNEELHYAVRKTTASIEKLQMLCSPFFPELHTAIADLSEASKEMLQTTQCDEFIVVSEVKLSAKLDVLPEKLNRDVPAPFIPVARPTRKKQRKVHIQTTTSKIKTSTNLKLK